MRTAFASVFLVALFVASSVGQQVAIPLLGAEVISFSSPPLAYISNLRYDPAPASNGDANSGPRILFIADKSSPNLYSATFLPNVTDPTGFYSTGKSQFAPESLSTYVSFDVRSGKVAGVGLATNVSENSFALIANGLILQGASVPFDGSAGKFNQSWYPGFQLMGVAIDPKSDINNPKVFLAGIVASEQDQLNLSTFGISIIKAYMDDNLQINFNQDTDMLPPLSLISGSCYDIYTPSFKPRIFPSATGNFFIVAFPGRCSAVFKITYDPAQPLNSSTTQVERFAPVSQPNQYVSSYAYDTLLDYLYYTYKEYQTKGATLTALDCKHMLTFNESRFIDLGEAEPVISIGNEKDVDNTPQRYVFVTAAGSNKIIRLNTQSSISKAEAAYATLGTLFNRISSTLYIAPYFYFGTNEPNAVLGRIHKDNFCSFECGDNAYCWGQGCLCAPGYGPDPLKTDPKTGQPICVVNDMLHVEKLVLVNSNASIVLGIMLAITTAIGAAGWYYWWKARQTAYSAL